MRSTPLLFSSVFVLLALSLQTGCSHAEKKTKGNEANATDYIVMLDVSLSMNDPEWNPALSYAKNALIDWMNNIWLPNGKGVQNPGRLYLYPFTKEVRPRRTFELTNSGAKEFEGYLNRLDADGHHSAIITTSTEVLETMSKSGRTAKRQYILITDGDETVLSEQLPNLWKNKLAQWKTAVVADQRNDQLLIMVIGSGSTGVNFYSFGEIMEYAMNHVDPVVIVHVGDVIID